MLEIKDLAVGHGGRPILRDINFAVAPGEVVCVLGANGVGKSTLVRTIAGLHRPLGGDVLLEGVSLAGVPAFKRVVRGLALTPEGQHAFPDMSVRENLIIAAEVVRRHRADYVVATELERVTELFPKLRERMNQPAGALSGGERQMLAISRALLSQPSVVMFDEPSHGLAPVIVEQVALVIESIAATTAVLVVEQNLAIPLHCAHRVLVLDDQKIAAQGGTDLLRSQEVLSAYLGM